MYKYEKCLFSTWAPALRNVCARPWLLAYQGYLIMFFINNLMNFKYIWKMDSDIKTYVLCLILSFLILFSKMTVYNY